MPVAVHLLYRPRGAEERLLIRDVHLEYMIAHRKFIRAGGAIVDDDHVVGMYLLLETEDKGEVVGFLEAEPYHRAGLFGSVQILSFTQFIPEPEDGFLHRLLEESRGFIQLQNERES